MKEYSYYYEVIMHANIEPQVLLIIDLNDIFEKPLQKIITNHQLVCIKPKKL